MRPSAQEIKAVLTAERYYERFLNGSFGKATGNGWHMWNGLCPFHADTRPGSFVINKATGGYRCFSCGARGGDIIDFHKARNGMGFKDALNALGDLSHA